MYNITYLDVPNHEEALDIIQRSITKGIRINPNITNLITQYQTEALKLNSEILAKTGIRNVTNPTQLSQYFRTIFTPEAIATYLDNGDKINFKQETLSLIAADGYPIADDILKSRQCSYRAAQLKTLRSYMTKDNLVHPELNVAKTNRIYYSAPALLNIPKDILWEVIIPRKENNLLYSIDIRQQEPYIFTHFLDIPELKELLREEPDFYQAVYKAVFKEACPTKLHREDMKHIWNALTYGMGEKGIKQISTCVDGVKVYKYFNKIPAYNQYKHKCRALAKTYNCQKRLTYFGTPVFADILGAKLPRSLMNIPIQGTGSDILAFLICHLRDMIKEQKLEGLIELYYTRHDEIILEVAPQVQHMKIKEYLQEEFTHQVDDWTPFQVKVKEIQV